MVKPNEARNFETASKLNSYDLSRQAEFPAAQVVQGLVLFNLKSFCKGIWFCPHRQNLTNHYGVVSSSGMRIEPALDGAKTFFNERGLYVASCYGGKTAKGEFSLIFPVLVPQHHTSLTML